MKKDNLKKLISNLPKYPNILGRERFFNSAVLIPLIKIKGEYHLLFQKRAATIRQGGDICFPGGGFEIGVDKSFKDTALRETFEELGIQKKDIKVYIKENKKDSEALNYNLEMLERMSKQILKEKRQKKLDEYNNSLKNDNVDFFIEKAKLKCKKMTIDELKNEIKKAELNLLTEFVEIYQIELNNRK